MTSLAAVQEANVLGFRRLGHMVYAGSFSWFCLLIGYDIVFLCLQPWTQNSALRALFSTTIFLNLFMFAMQTWDYLFLHFHAWPITALNWMAQLGALALCGGSVGYALVVENKFQALRTATAITRLLAQALFTASQFAVTLEFLVRNAYATKEAILALQPVVVAKTANSHRASLGRARSYERRVATRSNV